MKSIIILILTAICYAQEYNIALFELETATLALKETYINEKEVTIWYDKIKAYKKSKVEALEVFYKENSTGNKYEIEGKYDEMIMNSYREIDAFIARKIDGYITENFKSKYVLILERRSLQIYHQEIPLIDITGLIITGIKTTRDGNKLPNKAINRTGCQWYSGRPIKLLPTSRPRGLGRKVVTNLILLDMA